MSKILIFDTDKSTSRNFRLVLEKNGFEAIAVQDKDRALSKIKNEQFDAVLIILRSPDIDGIDLLIC